MSETFRSLITLLLNGFEERDSLGSLETIAMVAEMGHGKLKRSRLLRVGIAERGLPQASGYVLIAALHRLFSAGRLEPRKIEPGRLSDTKRLR